MSLHNLSVSMFNQWLKKKQKNMPTYNILNQGQMIKINENPIESAKTTSI